MDTLELCNQITRLVIPAYREAPRFPSLDTLFKDVEFDSLEVLMGSMYLCEIYGVSEETSKELPPPKNWKEALDGIEPHITARPVSIEAAMKAIK